MVKIYFLTILAVTSWSTLTSAQEANTVIIIGRKHEVSRPLKSGGQAVTVTPSRETGFDSAAHLKTESSLSPATTGRPTPSGFVVPRIRGQDSKVSEVYFEDFLLQDPYSGLPLVEDIDLRAFGKLEIFQGLSPFFIPSTSPIGAMRYRLKAFNKNSYTLGSQVGKPHGVSGFGLARGVVAGDDLQQTYQLYYRNHLSNGRYSFYHDHGTPYNKSDDYSDERRNNHQRSQQVLPFYKIAYKNHEWSYLGWWHEAHRGVPTITNDRSDRSSEDVVGHLNGVSWKYQPEGASMALPKETVFSGYRKEETRALNDESRSFLPATEKSELHSQSNHGALRGVWEFDAATVNVSSDYVAARILQKNEGASDSSVELRRRANGFYAGIKSDIFSPVVSETKLSTRYFADRLGDNELRSREIRGLGQTFSGGSEFVQIYIQGGRDERAPSLLEEFGNGSAVQASAEIEPEVTRHLEAGFMTRPFLQDVQLALALFQDDTEQKIVFVPSLLNTAKAINLERTRIRGVDAHVSGAYKKTRVEVSGSRYAARDLSIADSDRQIPNVPEVTSAIQLEQEVSNFTARWLTRYRSKVFRDRRNSVETPEVWVSDASLDAAFLVSDVELKSGLGIYNVFDVKKVDIESPASGEEGYTAYSEVNGYPLPGRHWKVSLSAEF